MDSSHRIDMFKNQIARSLNKCKHTREYIQGSVSQITINEKAHRKVHRSWKHNFGHQENLRKI